MKKGILAEWNVGILEDGMLELGDLMGSLPDNTSNMRNSDIVPKTDNTQGSFVTQSAAEVGAIFAFVPDAETLNRDLPRLLQITEKHNVRFIGMISGLLEFIVEADSDENLVAKTHSITDEIAKCVENRAALAWTVQKCSVGCWGDQGTYVVYGAVVANFRIIMTVLSSSKLGDCIRI